MALVEAVSKTDTALERNYAIIEECQSTACWVAHHFQVYLFASLILASPNDFDEMVARSVKCVNEKDPNLLRDMVRHDDNSNYNVSLNYLIRNLITSFSFEK